MKAALPRHLAIIMDGNGRWAQLRGKGRTHGHLRGARVAREMIEKCSELGVSHLTLYAFSTENWLRPIEEVSFLMHLLGRHLRRERANLIENNIRFTAIGELDRLPQSIRKEVELTRQQTAHCTGLHLTFALSYGGQKEILEATRRLAALVAAGEIAPEQIGQSLFESMLYDPDLPDVDMIIRTSGESRVSNFLLWQSAYSELYFTSTLWPDFTAEDLAAALKWYGQRERRFGAISASATASGPPAGASTGGIPSGSMKSTSPLSDVLTSVSRATLTQ